MARLIRVADVAPQPWRNGGGLTRELLAWPSAEHCQLRIALADITVDGPFSTYEGVERWIVVMEGVGIDLGFRSGKRRLLLGDEPLSFDGADAPSCQLVAGATRDLNLMVHGGRGAMRSVRNGEAWTEEFAMRGVFTVAPGELQTGDGELEVPPMSLWWDNHANGAWSFRSRASQAWWLGFTPAGQVPFAADS